MSGTDHDVEPDQHQRAAPDKGQIQRSDVIGVAQRKAHRVGRHHPGDDRGDGHAGPASISRQRTERGTGGGSGAAVTSGGARRGGPWVAAQLEAGQHTRQRDRDRREQQAGDVVDDVVPAQVDRRRERDREQQPRRDLDAPVQPQQMDRQDAGEEDRDVQGRERRDALRGAAARVPQKLQALVEQKLLKAPHAGERQIREGGGLGVDRSHRRQEEVASRPQQPVDRLCRRVEQAGPQVAREDERSRERHRDEREEQHVSRRHHMRGESGAQEGMHQRRRILAEEQGPVQIGELAVEVLRAQQRNDALEVAIGEVGQVEADQRAADGKAAAQAPALAADRLHRCHRRAAACPTGERRGPRRRARRAPRQGRGPATVAAPRRDRDRAAAGPRRP